MFHPRLAQVKPGSDLVVPKVRKAFPDTAYWNPTVHTGPDGHARVEFNFPDALTTWRTTIRGDDRRWQGRRDGDAGAGAEEPDCAAGCAAVLPQGDEVTLRVIAHNYLETAEGRDVCAGCEGAGGGGRADSKR
jgi:uncharacterized protein YfaS (alpha-2-macroglobulin family)